MRHTDEQQNNPNKVWRPLGSANEFWGLISAIVVTGPSVLLGLRLPSVTGSKRAGAAIGQQGVQLQRPA